MCNPIWIERAMARMLKRTKHYVMSYNPFGSILFAMQIQVKLFLVFSVGGR